MPIGNITIDWEIRHPITKVAGIGRVRFHVPRVLLDGTDNVIYGPGASNWITLDSNGRGSIQLPDPHDVGLTPQGWAPIVEVDSDVWKAQYPVAIPTGSAGQTLHLNDLSPVVGPIDGDAYSLIGHTHSQYLLKTGGTITGPISWDGTPTDDDHLAPKSYVDAAIGSGGGAGSLPLFNVEDYGAVGDGTTDDYPAIRAAWNAMLASPVGGLLYFPRAVTYRVIGDVPGRLAVTADEARALFPLPMRSRQLVKLTYGVLGVGDAYVVRTADLGSTPGQVQTASVLRVDYAAPFTWDAVTGLPCVFGAPDADATDPSGNTFTNLHFTADNLIVRQPTNPSLCGMNLEQCSTVRIGALRFDVNAVLDLVPEPTRPTGVALLLPRSNNNVVVAVDRLITEGHYAGVPLTEHLELRTAITLRCKIGVHTRRLCSHYGKVHHLKIEQCPQGISGWNPAGASPSGGVVPIHGWTGHIDFVDIEDYAYNGTEPWLYAPTAGVHINDPDGRLNGQIGFLGRINSEPVAPAGIGIGPGGGSSSLYVRGPSSTTASPIAIYGFHHGSAATRILPPGDLPATEYRLFPSETGPSTSATDSQPINLAVKVDPTAPVLATKLHFYRGNLDITGTITGRLWRVTGAGAPAAVAGSDVTFTLDGTGWHTATFTDPIALDPAETYAATVRFPDRFPFTAAYWDSGPGSGGIVNGPLTAFSTNDTPGGQGVFSNGAISNPPTNNGNGANYWVDLTVVDA